MGVVRRALAAGLAVWLGSGSAAAQSALVAVHPLKGLRHWAVYYGAAPEAAASLARFDLVVLDPNRHPPLEAVKRHGALVLAYVSLGEINIHHPDFPTVAKEPWVLGANPNWPEARKLDVRAPAYTRWMLDRVVPGALAGPVNGLFLDTADTALEAERRAPGRFGGAEAALGRLLGALREGRPRLLVVLNGGLPLAERHASLLDGVAVESVWTDYDFAARAYRPRETEDAASRAERISRLAARGLTVLTLEYAPPDDAAWTARLIDAARGRGFVPYVSTIGLDQVFTATLSR